MTPRSSIVGMIARGRRPWLLRIVIAVLVAACAIFTLFPQKYRAAVTITPTDPSSMGLSGTLGQLGAINSVFGNQAALEIALKVARGIYVRQIVIRQLDLQNRLDFANPVDADRWLEGAIDVRSLRGGIVQIEYRDKDPVFARLLVETFTNATRNRLAQISQQQTAYKRTVLERLVQEASDRLARAQGGYDRFRLQTRYGDPVLAIEAIGDRIPVLQSSIKAKEVQLSATRQFFTDDNMTVRQILAELDALRQQLAAAQAIDPRENNSVGRVVEASTKGEKLARELMISQRLYDNYMRFLEGTSVEDLTSTASVRVLEPPYIDTARQLNLGPLAIGVLLLVIGLSIEVYRLRPPVGDARVRADA